MKHWIALLIFMLTTLACGSLNKSDDSVTSESILTYELDREFIAIGTNNLTFTISEDMKDIKMRVSGEQFNSSVTLDTLISIPESIELTYDEEGTYYITLEFFKTGDIPFLTESLRWEYKADIPADPIISFSETATSDSATTMLLASTREPDTNEIWVEGDRLGTGSLGFWDTLSTSGLYPLTTSNEDGTKTFKVKLRNKYGAESNMVTAQILKKSTPPTDCEAHISSTTSSNGKTYLQFEATDILPAHYQMFGDIKTFLDPIQFSTGESIEVELSSGVGEKNITAVIQDIAGNTCHSEKFTVNVDMNYNSIAVVVADKPYWTDTTSITLGLTYDHIPAEEPITMKITGDVTGANANTWLPFAETQAIELTAGDNKKAILAQFKDKDGNESIITGVSVFLNPSMVIQNGGTPPKNIITSNIPGTTSITITGCDETYDGVSYQSSFGCTPNAATVDVEYTFKSGATLTLSETP